MRILIDECAPRALKKHLINQGHECRTVQEAGWSGKENGDLLSLVEAAFDVLVTVDTNLRYQQNLTRRKIAIVVLQSSSNRLEHLRQHFPAWSRLLRKSSPAKLFRLAVSARNKPT
jgi:predicted nuclease of predicted toxin-antitoxin system